MTTPNQRFTVGLVPNLPPTPTAPASPTPAATAPPASASAADTVTGEDGRDLANRLFNRPGVAGITAADSLAIHALVDRAEAAEAERDAARAEAAALREWTGLHLARGVVVVAGTGRGPVNALVELEDGRRVVAPRGQLFKEEV